MRLLLTTCKILTNSAGCFICGSLIELFGCVICFQVGAIFWLIGTIIVFFLPYIYLVALGRILKGITMGIISSLVPVYVPEAIPMQKKGYSLSLIHLSSTLGTLGIYYIGFFFQKKLKNELSFKFTWALEAVPAIVLSLLSFLLPESPKWLASKNRWQQAAKNIDRIQRSNTYKKIERATKNDREYVMGAYTSSSEFKRCTYADLFKKKYLSYTLVGILTQGFVQMTCVDSLMYFFDYICASCGLRSDHKVFVVSAQYATLAIFTLFPAALLDGCRRKDSLTFGMIILSISFFCLGLVFSLFAYSNSAFSLPNSPIQWEVREEPASIVLGLFLFVVAIYGSFIVSVSWLYVGEIFPGPSRPKGTSLCMCTSWIIKAILTLSLPYSFRILKYWTFFPLSLSCLIGGLVISRFPETRDLLDIRLQALEKKQSVEVTLGNSHKDPRGNAKPKLIEHRAYSAFSNQLPSPVGQKNSWEMPKIVSSSPKAQTTDSLSIKKNSSSSDFNSLISDSKKEVVKSRKRGRPTSIELLDYDKDYAKRKMQSRRRNSLVIDEVIEVYTAQETPETEEEALSQGDEDSYYSNDWFEQEHPELELVSAKTNQDFKSPETTITASTTSGSAAATPGEPLEATNFLNFDTLRIALKSFYRAAQNPNQTKSKINRKKGSVWNGNPKSSLDS